MPVASFDLVAAGFLSNGVPADLTEQMLESFVECKRRFHLGDFRPQAVEGGRFSEAVLRVLEWMTSGSFTPLSDPRFKADEVMNRLARISPGSASESARLHLPRAVRVIYDIRNKRNTAHLSDGISPNVQDATLVISTMNWILAELVRLNHSMGPSETQALIENIVTREVPLIQVFDGKPRILKDMTASDHCLVLIYWAGRAGVSRKEFAYWLPPNMRTNVARTLSSLHSRFLINLTASDMVITGPGERDVERRNLVQPI